MMDSSCEPQDAFVGRLVPATEYYLMHLESKQTPLMCAIKLDYEQEAGKTACPQAGFC